MKNVTVTLDEETAAWARVQAARRNVSLSRFVGELVQQHMRETCEYDEAMRRFLSRGPFKSLAGSPERYPSRDETGWTARFEKLKAYFPDDVYFISPERIFGDLESSGPLVMSTALGNSTWGKTGGGHVIEIESADLSDFHVNDPAGDYFKGPTAHYNSKSCGATARYPHGWMFAMTAGRQYISMGPRTLPWKKPSARAVLQTVYGSAVAVYDTVPDGADLATSFYLENTTGQRAGWVAGEIAEEIPNASVAQPTPEWTNPSAGDPVRSRVRKG